MYHGGPMMHLIQIKKHIKKLGIDIELMDMWKSRDEIFNTDLFHLHASNISLWDLANYLHSHKSKFIVTPIFFTRRSAFTIRNVCKINSIAKKLTPAIWSAYSISKDICNWAQHVLPNTNDEARLIRNGLLVPNQKITTIPNGVEKRFADSDPTKFYKKYGIKDFILNVGHIGVPRKKTLSLIRALSKIDHPAVIIGRIYPSKEADLCLEEGEKNKNLTIIPGINHDSSMLASAYAASSVFALPAMYETPGIAALEAGLAGAKVVITPYGGTKDYFKDMAIYINPYNINSIRSGIEKALNQDKDEKLKDYIGKNFLWEKVAELTANVYKKILET